VPSSTEAWRGGWVEAARDTGHLVAFRARTVRRRGAATLGLVVVLALTAGFALGPATGGRDGGEDREGEEAQAQRGQQGEHLTAVGPGRLSAEVRRCEHGGGGQEQDDGAGDAHPPLAGARGSRATKGEE
jgi:hypothetical protein